MVAGRPRCGDVECTRIPRCSCGIIVRPWRQPHSRGVPPGASPLHRAGFPSRHRRVLMLPPSHVTPNSRVDGAPPFSHIRGKAQRVPGDVFGRLPRVGVHREVGTRPGSHPCLQASLEGWLLVCAARPINRVATAGNSQAKGGLARSSVISASGLGSALLDDERGDGMMLPH